MQHCRQAHTNVPVEDALAIHPERVVGSADDYARVELVDEA